jgi:importin-5
MIIKKNILTKKENVKNLSVDHFDAIVKSLTSQVNSSTLGKVLHRIAEIVSLVFHLKGEYVQFFDYLDNFKTSNEKNIIMFVIDCLDEIAPHSFSDELLEANSKRFEEFFSLYMQNNDIEISTKAACTFISFITFITDSKLIVKYKQPFKLVIDIMVQAIKSDENAGVEILQQMNELSSKHPSFLKDFADKILDIYTEIVAADVLANSLRSSALDNIVEFAAAQTAVIKKSKVFSDKTLGVMLKSLMDSQDDDLTEWYESADDVVELNSDSIGSHVIQAFAKLNDVLGVKFMMPKLLPSITSLIPNDNWKAKYTGLMVIAMIFTGCKEHFESEISNFTKLVIPTIKNAHPKVQYASMTAIALLAEEFTPDVQTSFSSTVLPIATQLISNSQHSKLRLRGISLCISFMKELLAFDEEKDCVLPFMPDLMQAVVVEFEQSVGNNNLDLMEEVLNLLSIIAGIMEENFVQYYANIMPGLIKLLECTPNTNEQ